MARKSKTAPAAAADTHKTAGTPSRRQRPVTEADYLAAIPLTPTTDEEHRVAYDGHTRECLKSGMCECNPFAIAPREIKPEDRVIWPHWRQHLAHTRYLDAKRAAA